MTAAIIGLAGALLGALTTLLGTVLNDRRQARREETRWRRDQRSTAWDGALRHLLRAANLRSAFTGSNGMAVVLQEHEREWFEDLVQAQFWLHQLVHYCSRPQLGRLQAAAAHLDLHIVRLLAAENYETKGFSIFAVLQDAIAAVQASAREELAGSPLPGGVDGNPESAPSAEPPPSRGNDDQTAVPPRVAPASEPGATTAGTRPFPTRLYNIPFSLHTATLDKLSAALNERTGGHRLDRPTGHQIIEYTHGSGGRAGGSAADFGQGVGCDESFGGRVHIPFLDHLHFIAEQLRAECEMQDRRQQRLRAMLEAKGQSGVPEGFGGVTSKAQVKKPPARRSSGHGRRGTARRGGRRR